MPHLVAAKQPRNYRRGLDLVVVVFDVGLGLHRHPRGLGF